MSAAREIETRDIVLVVALATIAALALRLGLLGAPGEFDEFYHLLAARELAQTGIPRILDGEYWRAFVFTRAVAGVFQITGSDGFAAARLVSVAAGTMSVAVLTFWIARASGPWSALLAGAFAAMWPQGILESEFARFYALHVLSFLAGAATLFLALDAGRSARTALLVLTAGFWALALHLQLSSAIGIAGALLAVIVLLALRYVRTTRGWLILGSVALVLTGLAVSAAFASGLVGKAIAFYRWTPVHAAPLRNYWTFYFDQLEMAYGLLWYATPLLAFLALRLRFRLALYCLAVFGAGFVVHSFGGMKALRYLSYAMPFLFAVWAIGLVAAVRLLFGLARPGVALAVLALLAVLISASPFAWRSLQLAVGTSLPPRGDWSGAEAVVRDWIDAPFIVTTRELHHLAYLGPYDLLASQSRVSELDPPREFGIDIRTGRGVFGSADSWDRVIACRPDGLLVTTPRTWDTAGLGSSLEPIFDRYGARVDIRWDGAVLAVRWRAERPAGQDCALLPESPDKSIAATAD